MLLTKEQIFAAEDIEYTIVRVPEWDKDGLEAEVKVKGMSAIDRINFEKHQKDLDPSEIILKIVLMTCVNENNERMFSDEDIKFLQLKSPNAILRIFNESIKLNTLNDNKIDQKAENFTKDRS